MIVADANLLAYLLLPGDRTEEAEAVFAADPGWVVPALCLSELRSVAMKYFRTKHLSLAEAHRFVERAEELVDGRIAAVESRRVLTLAAAGGCSTYDAEYVALAEALDLPLVTTDLRVVRAFPRVAVTPAAFAPG